MAIAPAEALSRFKLGAYELTARAPEEFHFGLKSMLRYFFYKQGPTIVQKGRVIPKPVTLHFKYHGADALDAFLFLQQMAKDQAPITLEWANRFAFNGYIDDIDATANQQLVTGTLTYQPTEDRLAHKLSGSLTAGFPLAPNASVPLDAGTAASQAAGFMQAVLDATNNLSNAVTSLQTLEANTLQPLLDFNNSAIQAVQNVQSAISTAGSIAGMPFQTASALVDTLTTAVGLADNAKAALTNNVLAPLTPILSGTSDYLAKALGLQASGSINDTQDNLLNLAEVIQPQTIPYQVQSDDTLQSISDLFGTPVQSILSANTGLSPTTLAAGKTIQVPL